MNKYNVVIGIEIHLELNTKSKMFSSAPNDFNAPVNENVNLIDIAYPGTMPTVNKEAVIKAIQLAKVLKMEIESHLCFDRKNYYYPDLPKGFQITQQFRPIGKNGVVQIEQNNNKKNIEIERIHIEEDTAKQIHKENLTYLNYNRAGVPLIEIVTKPVINNANEAVLYVDQIIKIAKFLNISDAKLEEGSLRADINISLNKPNEVFGTKVEIKNINSLNNIKKAIELEIQEQTKKLDQNLKITQQTKRFDDIQQKNIVMREKTDSVDYRYFPEPNIPIMKLSDNFINSIKVNKMHWEWIEEYQQLGINNKFIEQLINDIDLLNFFEEINYEDKNKSVKFLFSEIVPLIKNNGYKNLKIQPKDIVEILNLEKNNSISSKQAKELVIYKNNEELNIQELVKKYKIQQLENIDEISALIETLIEKNKEMLNDYSTRRERVLKFFLGQIMKETKGNANPQLANKILIEKIEKIN
ncbi:Asp-tRNA(Asn)/Glu-tRNA(Gln) amidotransferase subunit GatB [Mesomycoplasma neurolyticum]|uniref:Aspartyl/glutamyl-tRNA(Asn/Gln) amidotransferase subunit B n=1 Tax=Mesomycoplasma neurolyticum TaxID=2120 RepID=A0A449A614_9BACT|nr:Asp-tRNA(Asn)/Glu-tRNA(Gln) amidotransferase subunit GatB [Mesomycoplasma neurolyticum]VEU59678.1 Aspartyl/glutamyl-tRNA(Asn/Gln) amidotransferase subunit B [Mesomycoplasma neurolyticum]